MTIRAIRGQSGAGMVGPWVSVADVLDQIQASVRGAPCGAAGDAQRPAIASGKSLCVPVGNHGDNKLQPLAGDL